MCGPDSKSLFYATEDAIWRVPVFGGTPVKIDLPLTQAGFSPDGKLMFYRSQKFENGAMQAKLIVAPPEDIKTVLHTFDAPFGIRGARFTPDSKALAFLLSRNRATKYLEASAFGKESNAVDQISLWRHVCVWLVR